MKRCFGLGVVLAVGALTLTGCTSTTATPTAAPPTAVQLFPLTFDNCGTKVTIKSRAE